MGGLTKWIAWLLLAAALVLQAYIGIEQLQGDLVGTDPPAHFVSGVLFYDYVRGKAPASPFAFAQCFYVHYPKVALGQWPPVFYLFECAWFLLFGGTIASARCLCAALAAGLAATVGWHCGLTWRRVGGICSAAILLVVPPVQTLAWTVMSDLLLALFVYMALWRFAEWFARGAARDIWWCVLWSSLAILTKGTAFLLPAVFVAAPMFSGRTDKYRTPAFWASVLLPLLISAPYFAYMEVLNLGYPINLPWQIHNLKLTFSSPSRLIPILGTITVVGCTVSRLRRLQISTRKGSLCLSMALWVAAQAGFLLVLPHFTDEWQRFLVPAMPPAISLVVGILSTLKRGDVLQITTTAIIFTASLSTPNPVVLGYTPVIDSIPHRAEGPVVWMQSDADGEGAVIARRLESDSTRSTIIVRGAKMLSDSTWSGYDYRMRYQDPAQVRTLLDEIQPDYIVFDRFARHRPDTDLLGAVLAGPDSGFSLISTRAISGYGRRDEILVYRRQLPARPGPRSLPVTLGPERGHRTISCPAPPPGPNERK